MNDIRIEPAAASDVPDILRLVEDAGLPLDGLENHLESTIVARRGSQIVGTAALEIYAGGALLRSVAVDAAQRGAGLGQELTRAALAAAAARQVAGVYLLTTTAEGFFPRFGFEPVARDEVPESVRESVEFRSACPASAVVMRKRLPG
jgi:amino-acid N-acetyltransferase